MAAAASLLSPPPAVSKAPAPRPITCVYVGIVQLHDARTDREVKLEVYLHPIAGRYFAVDANHTAENGASVPDFIRGGGRRLDLSEEPPAQLPQVKTCRFLQAVD